MNRRNVHIGNLKNNMGQVPGLPKNPRILKDDKYHKLKQSIQDDPEFLELREVIAYDHEGELVVICGNMRLRILKELGVKEVPTKILPQNTPLEKLKAYTIKDNVNYGDHDWDALANDWDASELEYYGVDIPKYDDSAEISEKEKSKLPKMNITFESPEQLQKAEIEIAELIDRKYKGATFIVTI